jgi:hypothetical protein
MNKKKNIFKNKIYRNISLKKKFGGEIYKNEILKQIVSIGFEFETGKMIPFIENNMILYPIGSEKHNIYTDNTESVIFNLTQDMPYTSSRTLFTKFSNNIKNRIKNGKICALIDHIRKPPLLFNLNKSSSMGHTEFHFTYKRFNTNNNTNDNTNDDIIIKALKCSADLLKQYFDHSKVSYLTLVTLQKTTLPLKIEDTINENISLYKFENNIVYILPNDKSKRDTINTIHFYIHMTIGVKLYNAINVLSYLLNNSNNSHKKIFEECIGISIIIVNKFIIIVNKFIIDNNIIIDNQDNQDIMLLVNKLYNWIALLLYFVTKYQGNRSKTQLIFILRHTYSEIFPLKNTILHEVWINFLKNSEEIQKNITNKCYTFMFNSSNIDPYNGLNEKNLLNVKNSKKFSYDKNIILIEYRGLNLDFKRITGRQEILLSDIDNLKNIN